MKKSALIMLSVIGCLTHANDDLRNLDTIGISFFKQRSQGSNTARRLAGITSYLYPFDSCALSGLFSLTPEYTHSFHHSEIGTYLFFSGINTMTFGPGDEPGTNVDALQFLLNQDFLGTITSQPRVQNALVDCGLYLNLDNITPGLYLQLHAPFCWTKWTIDFSQQTDREGTVIDAELLGNPTAQPAPDMNIIQAWAGTTTFFDVKEPLAFAKVQGGQTAFGGADLQIALGYTVLNNHYSHLGFNLRTIIPTGNRPTGIFFFEPIHGNAHHYELGGGFNGHLEIWNSGEYQTLIGFAEGNIYHMFQTKQVRTFDLKENGTGSRYLLLKRFNVDGTYAGEIIRGPNVLTRPAQVQVDVHADSTFLLEYRRKNVVVDIGYNLWGMNSEDIEEIDSIPDNTFGIAGNSGTGVNADQTASMSRITGEFANEFDKRFISTNDLDPKSAEHPGAYSHKLFIHVGYNNYTHRTNPFIGVGLEAEFSGRDNNALSQIGIWLKGGVAF